MEEAALGESPNAADTDPFITSSPRVVLAKSVSPEAETRNTFCL